MLINEYFQEIRHLIEACPIIQSYNLITDSRSLYVGFIRGDLNLVDFPLPLNPVKTTSLFPGMEISTFFRLCTRAPYTCIVFSSFNLWLL